MLQHTTRTSNPQPFDPALDKSPILRLRSRQVSDLQICTYQSEAIPDILRLTQKTLGNAAATRKTEALWRWKHHLNPFGLSYGLFAWAEVQQRVVGLRVLMRWEFQTPAGHSLQTVRAVDTATHPGYQRQGIFSALTRQAIEDLTQEGIHFIFNTPNQRSLPGYLKLGWEVVDKWPVFIKPLKPWRMLKKRLGVGMTSPPPDQFEAYFEADIVPWSNFVKQYGSLISELVANWERQRRQVGCRTPRDLEYLQWRYGQHPHLTYGVYALESSDGLAGFAVLRPNLRYGWQEIVLTDIFLSQPNLQLGRLFLKNLSKQIRGDYLVAHFAGETIEKTLLRQAGFIRIPGQGITFTGCPLNPLSQNLFDSSTWDLTLGDLEVF